MVCSVDPPGCKDIDDALHARPLPGGNLELGVHIADVTHFLLPGTAMDAEAASRCALSQAPPRHHTGVLAAVLCQQALHQSFGWALLPLCPFQALKG